MLQACLNGARHADEHPAVATSPERCAAEAVAAVAAGADDLHVHPRSADGRDSLAPADVGAWVGAVRAAVPVPVGVTTGAWASTGGRGATSAVRAWEVLPDHASVNWHESAAESITAALVERGVRVHAGLWSEEAARSWLDSDWVEHTDLVLLELPDLPGQEDAARRLLELAAPAGRPMLLHGEDRSAWPVLDVAVALGIDTRIGLEDVVHGPGGEDVDGNAALVRAAVSRGARA